MRPGDVPALRPRRLLRTVPSIWFQRRSVVALARHSLRRTYAGTVAGAAWTLLGPLFPFVLLAAVFSFGLRLPLGHAPYVYGFAAAYVPWLLLTAGITAAAGSIVEHRQMVKRLPVPIEIVPAAPIVVQFLPHVVLLAVTAAACVLAGHGGLTIALLPYFFVCTVVLALAIGLGIASTTAVIRDIPQVLPPLIQVWFWLTPVAWAADRLPAAARRLLVLNPASYVVSGYRHALMPRDFPAPTIGQTAAFWTITAALTVLAGWWFERLRPHIWESL